ncbi:MAG: T9SS type A sorting domain-containing protein, partial [Bacteroidales bacterium]|nr:T9SS type A sorting domain-containing protein [Bacteroidales bacterium]
NYMEFPYSADAGAFQLAIKDIVFTGGEQDFRWFGEDKTDNSHDGFGGAGQLIAEIVPSQLDEDNIQEVAFFVNNNLICTDIYAPFECEFIPQEEGVYETFAVVKLQNQQTETSDSKSFLALAPENPISELSISFLEPTKGDSALVNQTLNFIPFIAGEDLETDMYLKTWNAETGYRKLKFGYDDQYIYGQFQDVIAGGNDTMEIVLKAFSMHPNWDRIHIRPSSLGLLALNKYISEGASDWITVKIPLSDFDSSIDFTNLSYIEFPYSADAGAFEIGIKQVRFIGGDTPFEWFGYNHFDNIHDGTGENGAIFAQLQIPNPNPARTDSVYFLVNGEVDSYSILTPYSFNYSSSTEQTKSFRFKLIDSEGYSSYSEPLDIKFFDFQSEDFSILTLTFDQDPGDISVSIAPLKYNKDFAYSLTLDDGKYDTYAYAFKLLNGGEISQTGESFDGLFYTNGCGNNIPFRGSTAWNSVNFSFYDLHINTPDYITWTQLQDMLSAKWDVLNHSYSHAAYGDTDYNFQISENQNAVFAKTGFEMTQFVVPSGDLNYVNPAFALGMQTVYSNQSDYLGYDSGIDIDAPFDTYQLKIYRRYMYDDLYNPSNIMDKLNEIAQNSRNGNHLWWNDFTHRVIPTPTGGSLVWETFKSYMQQIADQYGANGTDRIWFAPQAEILNYLKLRENTSLAFEKSGNTVCVYLNTVEIPENFLNYFLSLNISTDAELLSVSPQFCANIHFANSSATEKLINIEWSQSTQKRMQSIDFTTAIEEFAPNDMQIYPNPLTSRVLFINLYSNENASFELSLYNAYGQIITSKTVEGKSGSNTFDLELPDLQAGVYFLNIQQESLLLKSEKILVQ